MELSVANKKYIIFPYTDHLVKHLKGLDFYSKNYEIFACMLILMQRIRT